MTNVINSLKNKISDVVVANSNEDVERQIADNIDYYSIEKDEVIYDRLNELANEWDVEKAFELNVAIATITGLLLAATVNKKWMFLPAVAAGLLARFALQGASAKMPFMGHLRTRSEIAMEIVGLENILKKGSKRYNQF